MKKKRHLRWAVVSCACFGLLVPTNTLAQGPPTSTLSATSPTIAGTEKADVVGDVALSERGTFEAMLVDVHGVPVAGAQVTVLAHGKPVATRTTDGLGELRLVGMQPGFYQLSSSGTLRSYRVWADELAPPGSSPKALMVLEGDVVRGQRTPKQLFSKTFITSVVLGVMIGLPIAVHQANHRKVASP